MLVVSAWLFFPPGTYAAIKIPCKQLPGGDKNNCFDICPPTYYILDDGECESPILKCCSPQAPQPQPKAEEPPKTEAKPAAQAPTVSSVIIPAGCLGPAPPASCGLAQVIDVFYNVANWIFAISGSLAFLFFVLGGFYWLTAAGNPERVKKGKTFVVNAAIGLVIIFFARAGVEFLVGAVTRGGGELPVAGAACKDKEAGTGGRYVLLGSELKCIASCDDLKSQSKKNYSCGAPLAEGDCETGLCPGGKDNVCCVR